MIVTRRLARRLHAMAQTAMAWSAGIFHTRIYDDEPDVIGQLAQDLNGMAGQVQSLALVAGAFPGQSGLALALSVGAICILPVGILSGGTALLNPLTLLAGSAVALFSSALPYALEIEALRRLPTHIFGIMMSAEPAIAALAGFLLLREGLSGRDLVALALVTCATLGVEAQRLRSKRG